MKESCVWILVLICILSCSQAKKSELLVDLLIHGVTAPRFTENPEYKVTSNSYNEDEGELTKEGDLQMEQFGKQLRREFIGDNQLLPNDYKPENFYHKVYKGIHILEIP